MVGRFKKASDFFTQKIFFLPCFRHVFIKADIAGKYDLRLFVSLRQHILFKCIATCLKVLEIAVRRGSRRQNACTPFRSAGSCDSHSRIQVGNKNTARQIAYFLIYPLA